MRSVWLRIGVALSALLLVSACGEGPEGAGPTSPPANSATPTGEAGRVAPGLPADSPGTAAVIDLGGGDAAAPATPVPPTSWKTYRDPQTGFAISYPDTYVALDQPSPHESAPPDRIRDVRFLDQRLAAGDTADLEPPQFRVEVFDNTAGRALGQWLDDHPVAGERTAVRVGGLDGVLVSGSTLMAPNQFYFLARGSYVYRLTPLGAHSQQMLDSFTLM